MNDNGTIINIFFDTNTLEARFDNKNLYLSELKIKEDFYNIRRFVTENRLNTWVELCIPEISWREIQLHLKNCFKSNKDALTNNMQNSKKVFGGLLDISYSLSKNTIEEIELHIKDICDNFIKSTNCKIVNYPREIQFFENLIENAINTTPPFKQTRASNKDYSDAGIKDAIIAEIIRLNTNNTMSILYTNDRDFNNIFKEEIDPNIKVFYEQDGIINFLKDHFKLDIPAKIRIEFENNEYLIETICAEMDLLIDDKYEINILNIIQDEDFDSIYNILLNIKQSEIEYKISVKYDYVGNSILDLKYEIIDN